MIKKRDRERDREREIERMGERQTTLLWLLWFDLIAGLFLYPPHTIDKDTVHTRDACWEREREKKAQTETKSKREREYGQQLGLVLDETSALLDEVYKPQIDF